MDWRSDNLDFSGPSLLPFGQGRSYGDSCLNDDGELILTERLDRFIAFDPDTRLLRCEAGMTLDEILRFIVPRGFFIPVSPGTKFVSVGGAIANDVHGKNHHRAGTFGRHVTHFELLRSNGRFLCSPDENGDLFRATIGGLGLTGLITWAEFRLIPIASSFLDVERVPFRGIDEFLSLSDDSDATWEYTVAWADWTSESELFGRGIFIRGNHAASGARPIHGDPVVHLPVPAPQALLNSWSIRLYNSHYFHSQKERGRALEHYDPFFYPLDSIGEWSRLYGRRGFFQYQFVAPKECAPDAVREIADKIRTSSVRPFLAILKRFGDVASPGMMSFPRPGLTVALDFANDGTRTLEFLEELDVIVRAHRGSVYPAKDGRMSSASFREFFPNAPDFARFVDPRFSSNFWRRVTER